MWKGILKCKRNKELYNQNLKGTLKSNLQNELLNKKLQGTSKSNFEDNCKTGIWKALSNRNLKGI